MKTLRGRQPSRPAPSRELAGLRARLADSEETLRAIRTGEVDTVMVAGSAGPQVFTLQGAGDAYRVLIESMNEGALTLTADKTILYANACFARMVRCPLEQVAGSSFRRFLPPESLATLRPLMKRAAGSGTKIQMLLHASDGSRLPVQISVRELPKDGSKRVMIGVVVTDMTEARRNEEMLRALSHRVVQAQEAERGRVALELHDNITQLLCALVFRSQTLAGSFSPCDGPARQEAIELCEMLGQTAEEVERISRNLRPGVLEHLGLAAVLRGASTEFTKRTGVPVGLEFEPLATRLPADTELALYRIFQEAMKNVEQHSGARHVTVCLTKLRAAMRLTIKDDGAGFEPDQLPLLRKREGGLGLLGMRERAAYVGGALQVKSARDAGTEIDVRIPLPSTGRMGLR